MIRLMKITFILVLVSTITGCGYVLTRNVPLLGGSDKNHCIKGERVYYYRDADVAICLPDVMVSYTHCVTELTVANTKSDLSSKTSAEVGEFMEKVKGLKLSEEQQRQLEKAFVSEGVIGEARAKAIDTCKTLTTEVYQGKTAPTIQDLPAFRAQ